MNYVTHTVCGSALELRRVWLSDALPWTAVEWRRVRVGDVLTGDIDEREDGSSTSLYCPTCNRPVTCFEGDPVGPYVGVQEGDV